MKEMIEIANDHTVKDTALQNTFTCRAASFTH